MISIIVALDEKRGIGKDNKVPWHIKEDLVRLRDLTKDHIVILGRKTFESMAWYYRKSGKEMPGKIYLVVTHETDYQVSNDKAVVAHSLEDAVSQTNNEDAYIIGGGQIFKEALEKGLVDRLYLTIVEGDYKADTFFPEYPGFKVIFEESGEEGDYKFTFQTLER